MALSTLTPFILFAAVMLTACSPPPQEHQATILAFGTLINLTYYGIDDDLARQATTALETDFREMHKAWHAWEPGELGRVNELLAAGATFPAPPSLLPLITRGQELERRSNGLFNPAIGKLIALWGFAQDDPMRTQVPAQAAIDALLTAAPRMADIVIDGNELQGTNPAVQLDLGGYAKGYGIDVAIAHLQALKVHHAIVNAGGDLRVIGRHGERPWVIGIRSPAGDGIVGSVALQDGESLFTSGNYERGYLIDGQRYHHIIDPRTGFPSRGIASATVLHQDATTADAAATALLIAGLRDWPAIAAQMGIRYALLIDDDGRVYMNPGMAKRVKLREVDTPPVSLVPLPAVTGPDTL